MEPKKNPRYDVHRYRGALFSVGLITALSVLLLAFAWQSEVVKTLVEREHEAQEAFMIPEIIPDNFVVDKAHAPVKPKNPTVFIEVKNDDASVEEDDIPEVENVVSPIVATLPVDVIEVPKDSIEEEFRVVEKMPEPEGGMKGFYQSLKKNLNYPAIARRHGTDGKVFVEFTVTRHGTLDNFKVIKGIGDGCDEEAIRVIKLTKWAAGKQRGVPVNVRLVQVIYFSLK